MKALWRRRAVRHVLLGLLPLLVAGSAVIAVLAVRLAETAGPVRDATARATATVQRAGFGPDRRDIQVTWTDDTGTVRTSTVHAVRASDVPVGARIVVRYRPGDPGRVFVTGDETSARLNDLAFGVGLAGFLIIGVLIASAVHIARRLAAERQPGTSLPATYARSRRGLLRRSWLVVEEGGQSWWVSVHWDPVLERLRPGTPVTVHGRPSRDRVLVADIEGTQVWQAGRRRRTPPPGEVDRAADREPAGGELPLTRQFRADAGLLAAAPLLGLLWAYVDDGGRVSWLLATTIAGAVLFWLPTVRGSDPT